MKDKVNTIINTQVSLSWLIGVFAAIIAWGVRLETKLDTLDIDKQRSHIAYAAFVEETDTKFEQHNLIFAEIKTSLAVLEKDVLYIRQSMEKLEREKLDETNAQN